MITIFTAIGMSIDKFLNWCIKRIVCSREGHQWKEIFNEHITVAYCKRCGGYVAGSCQ